MSLGIEQCSFKKSISQNCNLIKNKNDFERISRLPIHADYINCIISPVYLLTDAL